MITAAPGVVRLLLLREKKPGHYHQVEGIAQAAARIAPLDIQRLDIRPRWFAHDEVRKIVMRLPVQRPAAFLKLLYGIEVASLHSPHFVVGSGRPTLAAGMLLAQHFEADFVYSGWTGTYDRQRIALMLVGIPRHAGERNVAVVAMPTVVDPDVFRRPRRLHDRAALRGADIAMLIGGPARGYRYLPADWRALADFVERTTADLGVRWHISTSRRSPSFLADTFAKMHAAHRIVEFIDYRSAGPASAGSLFGCDALVVTDDSRSMLAEAVATRRPVIALTAISAGPNEMRDFLAGRGALAVLAIAGLSTSTFADALVRLRPPAGHPADEIVNALIPLVRRRLAV